MIKRNRRWIARVFKRALGWGMLTHTLERMVDMLGAGAEAPSQWAVYAAKLVRAFLESVALVGTHTPPRQQEVDRFYHFIAPYMVTTTAPAKVVGASSALFETLISETLAEQERINGLSSDNRYEHYAKRLRWLIDDLRKKL